MTFMHQILAPCGSSPSSGSYEPTLSSKPYNPKTFLLPTVVFSQEAIYFEKAMLYSS